MVALVQNSIRAVPFHDSPGNFLQEMLPFLPIKSGPISLCPHKFQRIRIMTLLS